MRVNVPNEIFDARFNQNFVALSSFTRSVSYVELKTLVMDYAEIIKNAGVSVLALHAINSIEWIIVDLACQQLGAICIPLPIFFTDEQISRCIKGSGVDLLISDQKDICKRLNLVSTLVSKLSNDNERDLILWKINNKKKEFPLDTQKITFTSGSTSSPKGVCLSRRHQWNVATSLSETINDAYSRHLCLLPFSTLLANIAGVYAVLLAGGEVIIPDEKDLGLIGSSYLKQEIFIASIDKYYPSSLILVPQMLSELLRACENGWKVPVCLKFVAVGGAKVSSLLIQQARDYGIPVYQGYGLSECGSVISINLPTRDHIDSVGMILPNVKAEIDNSEIVISSPVHLGYLEDKSTWYPSKIYTGDIGYIKEGFLYIEGRIKNVIINSFGRNICPEWVESHLLSRPFLTNCIVIGDNKPFLVALLSASFTVSDHEIDDWIAICNAKLPDYARVLTFIRLSPEELAFYFTENGRPKRKEIISAFNIQIESIYASYGI